jgi:hypothetical protein
MDDMLFKIQPEEQQVRALKTISDIYEKISGLRVNLQKSEMLVTSAALEITQTLAEIMECKASTFSFNYFGMLLSDKKTYKRDLIIEH